MSRICEVSIVMGLFVLAAPGMSLIRGWPVGIFVPGSLSRRGR